MPYTYEKDGATIYEGSFKTIRAEADISRFTPEEEIVTVRMIHAAGRLGSPNLNSHLTLLLQHGLHWKVARPFM